jgi:hypothetical protein
MKKLKSILCFSLFIFSFSLCEGQSWDWGVGGNGLVNIGGGFSPVATDKNGNAYLGCSAENTTVIFTNDTLYGSKGACLLKYNSAGTPIWARQIDGPMLANTINSVVTDKNGNICVAGVFLGRVRIDTFLLSSGSGSPLVTFVAKYDSTGKVLWARQSHVPSANCLSNAYSAATDKFGNVFITGFFQDTVSFGSFTLSTLNTHRNNSEIFLVKYDSNGNVVWAKQSQTPIGVPGGFAYSVATDSYGNAYIGGYFWDTLSFGTNTLSIPIGGCCSFLVKYSSSGTVLWAKQSTNHSATSACFESSLTIDKANNPYISGYFSDTVIFGSHALYAANSNIVFTLSLVKYDTSGNVDWAVESAQNWFSSGLSSDAYNHIYLTGYGDYDTLTFGSYSVYANPSSVSNSFLMEFDTTGHPICGSMVNNLGYGVLNSVASDSSGKYIYLSSIFNDTIYCASDTLISLVNGLNTFLGRWQNCGSDMSILPIPSSTSSITIFPNPNVGAFTIQVVSSQWSVGSKMQVEIYNVLGEKVYSSVLPQTPKGALIAVNIGNQPNGIYLYRVLNEDGGLIGEGKVVIEK